jgi:hypothetical protein
MKGIYLLQMEDDTNFLVYFSHNAMPTLGLGYIFIAGQGSQAYAEMLV